jgi:hypothetical protein
MSASLLLTRRELLVTLAGAAASLACGHRVNDEPVAIAYGREECAWCRMTVDDPRLAAEWLAPGEAARIFGEPGCLLSWLAAHSGATGSAWVRVREGDRWVKANEATFVHGLASTPMNFNLTAHVTAPAGTTALTWAQLLEKGAPDARPS